MPARLGAFVIAAAVALVDLAAAPFMAAIHHSSPGASQSGAPWVLVWSDDFEGGPNSGVDTARWIYDIGTSYPGGPPQWGTGEVETMTDSAENVYQSGSGLLYIKPLHNGTSPTQGWTSGRIETVADFNTTATGGLAVEASIKLPTVTGNQALGYWPAFWMLGSPYRGNYWNWPSVGEIDVMEHVNGRGSIFAVFHCGTNPGGACNEPVGLSSGERACPTCQTSFRTYRVELDRSTSPQTIKWYLDGVNFFTVSSNQVPAQTWADATDHAFFIILNVAIGGGFPAAFGGGPTTSTVPGSPMIVDYVRVYQWPVTLSAPAFTTQPTNRTVVAGTSLTLSVATTGAPEPTVRWQISTNGGVSYSDLANGSLYSGVTTRRLSISAAPISLSGARFRAVATSSEGAANSTGATLTVIADRLAFGLTSLNPYGSTEGGWLSVRSGASGGFGARPWTRFPWSSYNGSGAGVHVAAGDVDGDGRDELVVGGEYGGIFPNGWIAVLDDAEHGFALVQWIRLPWAEYNASNGEVWPAVGDVDGDGRAEIVAGLGQGGAGWFAIFDDAGAAHVLVAWRRVAWPTYNAGHGRTFPAIANLDGTGPSEIVLGLGSGSNGWIEIFTGAAGYSHHTWMQVPWHAYNAGNGETHPAAGDLDGDGRAEIVIGLGAGGGGWLLVLDDAAAGHAVIAWRRTSWANYNLDSSAGQIFPAVGDVDEDGRAEIVLGLGAVTPASYPAIPSGVGGWFEILDDNGMANASLGWRNVGWPAFTAAGGGVFPAIGRFR